MKTKKNFLIARSIVTMFTFYFSLLAFYSFSQGVAINTTGNEANNSAMLDISCSATGPSGATGSRHGILIPRISLSSNTDVSGFNTPLATSLMIYNDGISGLAPAGFYYWNGTQWIQAIGPQGPTGNIGADGITGATGADGALNAWGLTGNTGTTTGTNFIGTTDSKDFVFKTNNTEWARITSAGNVGIGTTEPNQKLHVHNASASDYVYVTANGSGKNAGIWLGVDYTETSAKWAGIGHLQSDSSLRLSTTGTFATPAITIDKSSNVGIGTTSPGVKLDVNGNVRITYPNSLQLLGPAETIRYDAGIVSPFHGMLFTAHSSRNFIFGTYDGTTYSGTRMIINTSGNVGIGTTEPSTPLMVQYPNVKTYTSATNVLDLKSNENLANYPFTLNINAMGAANLANRYFALQTQDYGLANGGNLVLQPSSGNVGIGTTGPLAKLDLRSDVADLRALYAITYNSGEAARFYRNSYGSGATTISDLVHIYNYYDTGTNTGRALLNIKNDDFAGVTALKITNSHAESSTDLGLEVNGRSYFNGNIGIGTTNPGQALTLGANKNVRLDWGGGTTTEMEMYSSYDYRMGIRFQGDQRLLTIYNNRSDATGGNIILSPASTGGKVGIGTTSPDKLLHVVGGAISGDMDNMTYSATISLDVTKGNLHKVNVTGAATINASAAGTAGQHIWILITGDATPRTITFGTNFKSAGTLSTVANKASTISFISDGTNWYEVSRVTSGL
ncbi:MAG: hypothetical protein HGB12_13225 [Bacteroidetes bacterium]|nr:hypothetical protein [Bacteroidota bacterium]